MADKWDKNSRVHRLDLQKDTEEISIIEYALDRVIAQPRGAGVGNHALLIAAMKEVFNVNLNKRDAVEGALWCLWRENDIDNIQSDDTLHCRAKGREKERRRLG